MKGSACLAIGILSIIFSGCNKSGEYNPGDVYQVYLVSVETENHYFHYDSISHILIEDSSDHLGASHNWSERFFFSPSKTIHLPFEFSFDSGLEFGFFCNPMHGDFILLSSAVKKNKSLIVPFWDVEYSENSFSAVYQYTNLTDCDETYNNVIYVSNYDNPFCNYNDTSRFANGAKLEGEISAEHINLHLEAWTFDSLIYIKADLTGNPTYDSERTTYWDF
ncbi:MAG: hypothetical protein C0593_06165 [Marinilabiliales bacterium]|nr:MAG: hypothetical protein C0593_06165 [Marinilabiliales bacterium]